MMHLLILLLSFNIGFANENKKFRLSLPQEPSSLDHVMQRSPGSSYFFTLINRNLFKLDKNLKPQPDLATKCWYKTKLNFICELNKNNKWSDGTPITSEHFLKTYTHMLASDTMAPRKDFLYFIKNAKEIVENKKELKDLGVAAPTPSRLEFTLSEETQELEFILCLDILAPTYAVPIPSIENFKDLKTSGPYKITEWKKNAKITLTPIDQVSAKSQKPEVEIKIVSDEIAVLNLFEQNELDLVQRVPTLFIPQFSKRADFIQIPVYRFDYLGFGPQLKKDLALRKFLITSTDFSGMQKIFNSPGSPGCTSLSKELMGDTICYPYIPTKEQFIYENPIHIWLSRSAGDDSKRGLEWLQDQWRKKLSLNKIEISLKEPKTFTSEVMSNPPELFRRGIGLEIPTCRNAILVFTSGHYENFIKYSNPKFDQIVSSLKTQPNNKTLCRKAINMLMDDYVIIPLGEFYFSMLKRPGFETVNINRLNQLFID